MKNFIKIIFALSLVVYLGTVPAVEAQSFPDTTAIKKILDKPLPKPPAFLNEVGKRVKNFSSAEGKDLGFSTRDIFIGLKEGVRDLRGFLGILIEFIPKYSRE